MTFGEGMKYGRNKLSTNQINFAAELGMSRDAYANMEYDRIKNLQAKETVNLLVYGKFGVNEVWLRSGEGKNVIYFLQYQKMMNIP